MDNKKEKLTNENKIAHLDYIERAIDRMGNNSASIKGWAMGIVAAILGIGMIENTGNLSFTIALGASSFIITIILCCLDMYYLYKERMYRNYYKLVSAMRDESIDFNMSITNKILLEKYHAKKVNSYIGCFGSVSIWPFYAGILIVLAAFFIIPTILPFIPNFTKTSEVVSNGAQSISQL